MLKYYIRLKQIDFNNKIMLILYFTDPEKNYSMYISQ